MSPVFGETGTFREGKVRYGVMGQTITQKIIAAHAGKDEVRPGDLLFVDVDVCLANDITAPIAMESFEKAGYKKVFDPSLRGNTDRFVLRLRRPE